MLQTLIRFSSFRFLTAFLLFSFCIPQIAAAKEPHQPPTDSPFYTDSPADIDYRDVTGLSYFARMAYRHRWTEIEASDVLAELSRFKMDSSSTSVRDAWHDLLLSDFTGLQFKNAKEQTDLMSERLRILNALGYFDEAVRLYQIAATKKPVASSLALEGVNALALSGSADGACLEVSMASPHLSAPEWQQDEALCSLYFGETARAEELYAKVADQAGSGFRTVYKLLKKEGGKDIQVNIPPLWRTLLLAQGANVPSAALKSADAETLASLAANLHVPLGTRLAAAEQAANSGTIGSDRVRGLYEMAYPEDKGMDSLVAVATANGEQSHAAYYAAARFTFEGNARATIVKNGIYRINPPTGVRSHAYNWIVDKLTLQVNKLGWFAPQGYSLMTLTNRTDSANMYYQSGNLEKTRFALVHALVAGQPWSAEERAQWEEGMKAYYKDKAPAYIDSFLNLARAYDLEEKLHLNGAPKKEQDLSISRDSKLYESTRAGGKGLTLAAALNLLGNHKKLSAVQTAEFVDIIDCMSKQGLFAERKKITLEFLIQNML